MTVCIAAVCPVIGKIVVASDRLMSGDWTSVEGVLKGGCIERTVPWIAMLAGHTPEFVPTLVGLSRSQSIKTVDDMIAACIEAHKAIIEKRIETEILLNMGLTRETFIQRGKEYLGQNTFDAFLGEINAVRSRVEMLVAGFEGSLGKLFAVSDRGVVTRHDQLLFGAIGTGADMALSTLYPHQWLCWGNDLYEVIYRILAAKFAAETARGVRTATWLLVYTRGKEEPEVLRGGTGTIDGLREVWRAEMMRQVPDNARKIISLNPITEEHSGT